MKLNIGCGFKKLDGFINIDKSKSVNPDLLLDVEKDGLEGIKDNSVDYILCSHFLEHMTDIIFVMGEIYRVCKNNAIITIIVPYFLSTSAIQDPTHKRFFTPESFKYFSKSDDGGNFDYEFKFDFQTISIEYVYLPFFRFFPLKKYLMRILLNVVTEIRVRLKVKK